MAELELASRRLEALQRQGLGEGLGHGLLSSSSASKNISNDSSGIVTVNGSGRGSSSGSSVSSFRSTSTYRANLPTSSMQGFLKPPLLDIVGDGDEDEDISPRTVTSAITATSPHSHRAQVLSPFHADKVARNVCKRTIDYLSTL